MLAVIEISQVTMLVAACSVLGTAIGVLYRQMVVHFSAVDEKLERTEALLSDCQEDRLLIWKQLAKQAGIEVEQLKNGNQ